MDTSSSRSRQTLQQFLKSQSKVFGFKRIFHPEGGPQEYIVLGEPPRTFDFKFSPPSGPNVSFPVSNSILPTVIVPQARFCAEDRYSLARLKQVPLGKNHDLQYSQYFYNIQSRCLNMHLICFSILHLSVHLFSFLPNSVCSTSPQSGQEVRIQSAKIPPMTLYLAG
jgi:hypothetical protein